MKCSRKLIILAVAALPATLTLADGLLNNNVTMLQKEYEREQARIDLIINKFQLDAANGKITREQAQDGIDQWLRSNTARLRSQAQRAAHLDRLAPLPAEKWPAAEAFLSPDNPRAARHAQLAAAWSAKMEELRGLARDPEDLQNQTDIWLRSPEAVALRQEKGEIEQAEARRWPLGTSPVVIEAAEDAPLAEVASLDFQEKVARRIMDLRAQNPLADDEEMQDLIDGKMEEFKQDFSRINQLLGQAATERLEAEVIRLQAAAEGN